MSPFANFRARNLVIKNLHKAFFYDLFVPLRQWNSPFGEVTEWSMVLAWKVSVPQKGTMGSNPILSAHQPESIFTIQNQ